MGRPPNEEPTQLTALLVMPNRELAREFSATLSVVRGFQVLSELKTYPSVQTLAIRLRQLQPDVLLMDLSADLEVAAGLIRAATEGNAGMRVIGLHSSSDSEVIVRSLRQGASEFLCAPFDPAIQHQALARIRKLLAPRDSDTRKAGTIVVFTSAKPGAGASTLAAQSAFALRELTGGRILLADLDPMSATVSFYLGAGASQPSECSADWGRPQPAAAGVDLLTVAALRQGTAVAPGRLHEVLEVARRTYAWILLDLPAVFHRSTLLTLPEADQAYLVTTPELPSLHLARKAVSFLGQVGMGKERVRVLVNRAERGPGLNRAELQTILNAPVHSAFPNEDAALDRALAEGEPLHGGSDLGRAVRQFARNLAGLDQTPAKDKAALPAVAPALEHA